MFSQGPFPAGDDYLPCIKGREVDNITGLRGDYDAVLQRLRHRRDHPETYKTIEIKVEQTAPHPPQTPAKPPTTDSKSKSLPSPTVANKQEATWYANEMLWIAAGVAVLIGSVWQLRRK